MYDFGVIGGDIRQMYMAEYLVKSGYSVFCYGVENSCSDTTKCIEKAIKQSERIVAPIPFSKDGKNIFLKNSYKRIEINELMRMMQPDKLIFSGGVKKEVMDKFKEKHCKCVDLLKDKNIERFNTIATIEGTIAEVVLNSTGMIYESNTLVTGYGKCGKLIAEMLAKMGSKVTVCVRREEAIKEATKDGYNAIDFGELSNNVEKFEYIINTVPKVVFDEKELKNINKNALIIDIASMPGGVNKEVACKYGLNVKHCLGIPGMYCPMAIAKYYVESIIKYINN